MSPVALQYILRAPMRHSRREFSFLLPLLAVPASAEALPSKTFRLEDLPVRKGKTTATRQMFKGTTRSGYQLDLHETELLPGQAPHPPHRHAHEEMLLIRDGVLEVKIGTGTAQYGPGSVVYVASNEEHGWRNVGKTSARYFVLALGDDKM